MIIVICKHCNTEFQVHPCRSKTAQFCSRSCLGKSRVGENNSCWRGGLPQCLECSSRLSTKIAIYCNNHKGLGQMQSNNPSWKGGLSKNRHNTKSPQYKEWVKSIFTRDDYTCQDCQLRGVVLQAHHKKSWANYPELRFNIFNGITLCVDCHKLTNNYKGRNNHGIL